MQKHRPADPLRDPLEEAVNEELLQILGRLLDRTQTPASADAPVAEAALVSPPKPSVDPTHEGSMEAPARTAGTSG